MYKLLVADDSATIQKVIRLALSTDGYQITAVSDGLEAIDYIQKNQPDVVLLDESLPEKSAIEVKTACSGFKTKFILMTGAFSNLPPQDNDFDAVLEKPFDPAHLRGVLSKLLPKPITPPPFPKAKVTPPPPPIVSESAPPPFYPVSPPPIEIPDLPEFDPPTTFIPEPPDLPLIEIPSFEEAPPPLITLEEPKKNLWEGFPESAEYTFEPEPENTSIEPEADIKAMTMETFASSEEWKVTPPSFYLDETPIEPSFSPEPPPPHLPISTEEPSFITESLEYEHPKLPSQDTASIQELVQSHLEQTISELTKKIIPEIAERIIKQEIDRLLENPPK